MTRAFPDVEIHTSFFMIVYVVLVLAFSILSVSEFSAFAFLRSFDSRDVQTVIMKKSKSLLADGNRPKIL